MSGYSIPYASDDSIKDTVIGYYRASSSGGEVSPEKAADGADISEDNLRRQRSFLAEIGILREGESGYALTDTGQEIGRALRHERDDDAKEPFGELLRGWEGTSKIMDDLGGDYVPEDTVLDSIGFVTDHELDNYRQKAGANGLIDLFVWTEVLKKNADGEYKVVEVESEAPESESDDTSNKPSDEELDGPTPNQPPQQVSNGAGTRDVPPGFSGNPEVPIDINLELTGDENPDNVHELIVAIRAGLEKEFDEEVELQTRSDGGERTGSNEDSSLDSFFDD